MRSYTPTMNSLIERAREQIIALCKAHRVKRFDVFGSALREDFDVTDSDLDAVVEFSPTQGESGLNRYFALKEQLERLLNRPVDLVELHAMPETRLKRIIQRSKVSLYAAPP